MYNYIDSIIVISKNNKLFYESRIIYNENIDELLSKDNVRWICLKNTGSIFSQMNSKGE